MSVKSAALARSVSCAPAPSIVETHSPFTTTERKRLDKLTLARCEKIGRFLRLVLPPSFSIYETGKLASAVRRPSWDLSPPAFARRPGFERNIIPSRRVSAVSFAQRGSKWNPIWSPPGGSITKYRLTGPPQIGPTRNKFYLLFVGGFHA